MGKLVDESNYEKFLNWCEDKWTREYKMKRILSKLYKDDIDFLEEQLKANVIALLTDLQLEIEEKSKWEGDYSFAQGELFCRDLIQEKINILRG